MKIVFLIFSLLCALGCLIIWIYDIRKFIKQPRERAFIDYVYLFIYPLFVLAFIFTGFWGGPKFW